ncbi:hypothetical protein KBD34_03990 [Patescibacteria group bacterium]|nr:hypothetical protein [Patescibacteria group bacterium]
MIQIKRIVTSIAVGALAFAPLLASAQTDPFRRAEDSITGAGGIQQAAIGTSGAPARLETIIGRIINVVLGFLGIILLFYVLWAGFKWMTAGGNTKQTDEARDMIKNAVIGMVIIVAGFAISNFVIRQLATLAAA